MTSSKGLRIAAISREVEFIALNVAVADELWEESEGISINDDFRQLSNKIYRRADEDVRDLLQHLRDGLSAGIERSVRVKWHPVRDHQWVIWGDIHSSTHGRKKDIGWIGLCIGSGHEGFRLIGHSTPSRGGREGRSEVIHLCQKKMPAMKVHLSSNDSRRYPDWPECVIWFSKELKCGMDRGQLRSDVASQGRKFLKIASPVLRRLAFR